MAIVQSFYRQSLSPSQRKPTCCGRRCPVSSSLKTHHDHCGQNKDIEKALHINCISFLCVFFFFSIQIDELLKGNSSANVSSFINSLANATKPGNEVTLTAKELSASVKMLVQLVNYNSLVNNSAVNTITDQQNIVQVASNLLEEENTPTWLYLQEVCEVNLGLGQTSNFSGEA